MSLLPNTLTSSPTTTNIAVQSLAVIQVSGSDAEQFLQGQLTCDLKQLTQHNWQLCGHCDAKGKLWSVSRIARIEDGFLLIQNRSTLAKSLAQLQKFSVFSQVNFTDVSEQFSTFVLVGANAKSSVATHLGFAVQEPYHCQQQTSVFALTENTYLLLQPNNKAFPEPIQNERYWQALQIEHDWPIMEEAHQETFIPQMLNLDTLGAISFKKGCYIGQETVARMHYKGMNKRRLFQLTGVAKSTPTPTDQLEVKLGENWRRAGAVISAVRYDSDVIAIQAVLPSDIEATAQLRIKGQDDSKFTPCQKPDETESINE